MSKPNDNFFLVIEGLDGTGKTEIAFKLVQVLEDNFGEKIKLTFEPHDPSCAGLFIRQVLMKEIKDVPLRTLALAFAANRSDHCNRDIAPFLNQRENRMVICDRYYLSSLVYQSDANLSMEEVMSFNERAIRPDMILYLEATNSTCYERMRRRNEDKQLFEKNLEETRQKYEKAIRFLRKRGEHIVKVNADGTKAEVLDNVLNLLIESGSNWLRSLRRPFSADFLPEVFSLNGNLESKMTDLIETALNETKDLLSDKENDIREFVSNLRNYLNTTISRMTYNEIGSLFIDCVRDSGYTNIERLPWTDLDAFEIKFELPMKIMQRGAAIMLGQSQKYDLILKKALLLDEFSDFMIVFDPNPSHLITKYYDRGLIKKSVDESLSPATHIVSRLDIAEYIFGKSLESCLNEFQITNDSKIFLRNKIKELSKETSLSL